MIDVTAEPIPDWATPVFIVDQDAKGLLGRMVCAYGPANKELEISVFPSADPVEAFEMAAFKNHHTVVDAIWGYTQFPIDRDETDAYHLHQVRPLRMAADAVRPGACTG